MCWSWSKSRGGGREQRVGWLGVAKCTHKIFQGGCSCCSAVAHAAASGIRLQGSRLQQQPLQLVQQVVGSRVVGSCRPSFGDNEPTTHTGPPPATSCSCAILSAMLGGGGDQNIVAAATAAPLAIATASNKPLFPPLPAHTTHTCIALHCLFYTHTHTHTSTYLARSKWRLHSCPEQPLFP